MTSKEKALDLQHRMKDCLYSDGLVDANKCALICVEKILGESKLLEEIYGQYYSSRTKYWEEVKEELLKL